MGFKLYLTGQDIKKNLEHYINFFNALIGYYRFPCAQKSRSRPMSQGNGIQDFTLHFCVPCIDLTLQPSQGQTKILDSPLAFCVILIYFSKIFQQPILLPFLNEVIPFPEQKSDQCAPYSCWKTSLASYTAYRSRKVCCP